MLKIFELLTNRKNKSADNHRQHINANIFSRGLNGYLNYCCYQISGMRMTSKGPKKFISRVNTLNEASAKEMALSSGLSEPISITVSKFKEPTPQQLEYAYDLGIDIPENACSEDVSCMICRITESDEKTPSMPLAVYADRKGAQFSAFIGEKAFLNMLFLRLEQRDKFAFFAYCVYCYLVSKSLGDLDASPLADMFYRYADINTGRPEIVASINKYNGSSLVEFGTYGGRTRTAAYTSAAQFVVKYIDKQKLRT